MKFFAAPAVILCLWLLSLHLSAHADEEPAQMFPGWGTLTDRDQDCNVRLIGQKLQIEIPATNHDMSPIRGDNAPRVLTKVFGDFMVQVKVTADFIPGASSTGQGRPFNGAGILIRGNDKNYLRIERDAYWIGDNLMCYPPLMEYWHDGRYSGVNNDPVAAADYFEGRSTWLRADRRGDLVSVFISHNGLDWKHVKTFSVELGDENLVGVAALNTSDLPFSVEFSEFSVERN